MSETCFEMRQILIKAYENGIWKECCLENLLNLEFIGSDCLEQDECSTKRECPFETMTLLLKDGVNKTYKQWVNLMDHPIVLRVWHDKKLFMILGGKLPTQKIVVPMPQPACALSDDILKTCQRKKFHEPLLGQLW